MRARLGYAGFNGVCVVYDACMYGKGLVWMLGDSRIHEVGRLWIFS